MAERIFVTSSPRVDNEASCESQDDCSVYSVPKRQKELVKLKYARRRRRFRKKIEKTPASSSDSEHAAKKSFELLSLNPSLSIFSCTSSLHQQHDTISSTLDTTAGFTCKTLIETSFEKQIEEDFSSSDATTQSAKTEKSTNWYSHLFGNFFDYVGM